MARDWDGHGAGRFRVSTVNACEALVATHGYDKAVERTRDDVRTFRDRGDDVLRSLAYKRLDCLRAYETTLRAAEAAREAHSLASDNREADVALTALLNPEGIRAYAESPSPEQSDLDAHWADVREALGSAARG